MGRTTCLDGERVTLRPVEEGVGREDVYLDGEYRDTHHYGLLEREWTDRNGG